MIPQHPKPSIWPWIVAGLSVIALVVVIAYSVATTNGLAQQGAESHKALCVLKNDYAKREADSKTFLSMTVKQREKKYGSALAHIPESVIQQSVRNLQANLDALKTLDC